MATRPRPSRLATTQAGNLIQVTIHNIGNKALNNAQFTLVVNGATIGVQSVGALDAPDDLVPRSRVFLFPYAVSSSGGTVTIQVQLQTSEPEITTANNQVTVTLTLPTQSPTSPGGS